MGLLMVMRGHGQKRRQRLGALDGGNIWWVAPSHPVASEIWRDLKKACRGAWVDKSEIERRIELASGGAVTVKSADNPDSLVGVGLDGAVIDEAATVHEEAWKTSIRPALSDRQGWAGFIGTPKGFNWLHTLYMEADHLPGWERWQLPSNENPMLTTEELAAAQREMGSIRFSQEYGAQFTAAGLGMFRREWFELVEAAPAKAKRVRSWDKAGTAGAGNWSAGVLMSKTPEGIYYVEDVVKGQWSSGQRNLVIDQTAELDAVKHGRIEIWFEQEPGSGGKESAEISVKRLAGFNVHAQPSTGDKAVRAAPFAAQCEAGNVKVLKRPWASGYIDELETFPNGQTDDQVDASAAAFNKLALKPGAALYRAS